MIGGAIVDEIPVIVIGVLCCHVTGGFLARGGTGGFGVASRVT